MSLFRSSLSTCAALAVIAIGSLVPSVASADQFTFKARLQGGYTALRTPPGDSDDYFGSVSPEVNYFTGQRRALVSLTYAFTGTLHTFQPNEIGNRLALTTAFEVAPATALLFSAEAIQASLGNYLLVNRSADPAVTQIPVLNTQLLTLTASEGLRHELSPVLRLDQSLTGSFVTSIDPDVKNTNYQANAVVSLDRVWKYDDLGVDLRGQFAHTKLPPIDQKIFTVGLAPRWGHDWTRTISTSASAGAQVAVSPENNTKPLFTPAGRGSVLFHTDVSGVELSYVGGIEPNLLIGTLLQSQQTTLRGYTPISEKHRVLVNASVGYLRAKTIDLSKTTSLGNLFDAFLADVDISWQTTDVLQVFGRYQLIDQGSGNGPGATASLVRHGIIFGIEIASRPPQVGKVPTQFPKRVDRSDAAPPPEIY